MRHFGESIQVSGLLFITPSSAQAISVEASVPKESFCRPVGTRRYRCCSRRTRDIAIFELNMNCRIQLTHQVGSIVEGVQVPNLPFQAHILRGEHQYNFAGSIRDQQFSVFDAV